MLAFSPLASAPLGADAARLPQILAQATSAIALGGMGAAGAGISAGKQSGTAADLPLGGLAQAGAKVRGQGRVGPRLGGDARAQSGIGSHLQSDVPVAGAGGVEARADGGASAGIGLRVAGKSAIGVEGSAVSALDFSRRAEAGSQVDVAAARSLPLVGHSAARLRGRGTAASTAVAFGIQVTGNAKVVPRGAGDFALDGLAQAECLLKGVSASSLTNAGIGLLATTAAAWSTGCIAIFGRGEAAVPAGASAEERVSLAGTGSSDVSGEGAGAISLSLGLRADGRTAIGAINDGAILLAGEALIGISITAHPRPTSLMLTGQAAGTILKPRAGAATGKLQLSGQAQAVSAPKGRSIGAIPLPGQSAAASKTRIVATGQLSLTRGIAAELQVTAKAGRTFPLAGAAGAIAQTFAGVQDPQLAFAGVSRASGDAVATGGADLALLGAVAASGAITATGQPDLDAELLVSAKVGAQAALATALDLRGAAACLAAQTLRAEGALAWQALALGETAAIGSALTFQDLSGGTTAAIAIRCTAGSALAVTRAAAGDVNVIGDSARQFGLGGGASARTTSGTQTSQSVVEVTGNARVRAEAEAHCATSIALTGAAKAGVPIAATTSASIGWITDAAATATRLAHILGALWLVGGGQARSAVVGATTAGTLAIESRLGGETGVAAQLNATSDLGRTARGRIGTDARGAGLFTVARDSAADVQVAGDAARALPLAGTAAGALVARVIRADGAVALGGVANAKAQTAATLPNVASADVQGHSTGAARISSISSGHVAFIRLGLGDVLVAGGAARGMALLGSAQAGNVTQAAANLQLAPRLAGSATNVIRVEFAVRDMGAAGRGDALASIAGMTNRSALDLDLTSYAFGAPPALRRSEPPRIGLSGRLLPTNTGQILTR